MSAGYMAVFSFHCCLARVGLVHPFPCLWLRETDFSWRVFFFLSIVAGSR